MKTPLQEVGRRDGSHIEQRVPSAQGGVLRIGHVAAGRIVEAGGVAVAVEGRHHGEDDLAVLHCDHAAGGEGPPVPVAVDLEDHGEVAAAGTQEVAVKRVWQPAGLDGGGGREQTLGRHLAAVEGPARAVVGVAAAEQILVDPFQREQRTQVGGEVHAPECAGRSPQGKWKRSPLRPVRPGCVVG